MDTRKPVSIADAAALAAFQSALDAHAVVAITNADGDITFANDCFCKISGFARAELIGQNHRVVNSGHHPKAFFEEMWSTISAGQPWRGEICNRSKFGDLYWVDALIMPLPGADGRPEKFVSIRFDITERVRAREAEHERIRKLQESETRLRHEREVLELALTASGVGFYHLGYLDDGVLYWSDEYYRLLGVEPGSFPPSLEVLLDLMHPDDIEAFQRGRAEHRARGVPYRWEFRLRHSSGEYRWFRGLARASHSEHGEPRRVCGVLEDIHDLKTALEGAEAANVLKSQFLANMSHEIRTPLNGMLGIAEALAMSELDTQQSRFVDVIRESGDALMAVLDSVLDLSRIEAGHIEVAHTPFSVQAVARLIEPLHTLKAREKNLDFEVRIEDDIDVRIGDANRLKQILHNLISNAIKYTDAGRVAVRISGTADALCIAVADTGCGMTPEQCEGVFEPFTQADSSISRRHGGSGLGLSIVRGIVTALGGEIAVDSKLDIGSTFAVKLPYPRDHNEPVLEPAAEESHEGPGRPMRALSAEDNPTNRMVIQTLLEPAGVEVTFAEDGRAAVDLFEPGVFDVVLLDIHMPEMNGEDAFVRIREIEREAGADPTPVYALTADVMQHRVERYEELGFDGCIPKPIQPEVIFRVLQAIADGESPQKSAAA